MLNRFATGAAIVVACAQVLGCGGEQREGEGEVAQMDTSGATSAAATAPPSEAPLSESNVVALLDAVNVSDSSAGALAAQKGSSSQVKEFGRMMVRDHHALREQSLQLAQRLNVSPQLPSGDTTEIHVKKMQDTLAAMPKGAAWDQFYISNEVTAHDAALKLLQRAQGSVQSAELRSLIDKAIPNVQGHLERAREIQRSLGSGAAGDTGRAGSSG